MPELPGGIVTFVFTDVEGSTRLWEDAPETMMSALNQHDEIIDDVLSSHDGLSVKPRGEGDSRFLVFTDAGDAVAAAAEIQRRFASAEWPTPRPIRVRASLHTGTADLQLGDYYGSAVNRAARLRGIAHGGQTVMSGATWELVQDRLPDGVTIRDMGRHGLKDLSRPEHVYQVDVEGLSADFPSLRSLDAVPNNLPEQLTEFVGRERELAAAERILENTRLLTILAPGGTGKTRLGIQVAADVIAEYPDGAYFVALADISSSDDIAQTIAESLGLGLSSDEDPRTQLLTYFSNKRQLLVLDNFEHVADGAVLMTEILRSAPGVKVIATSRAKLNVMGETVLTLGGLDTDWDTPEEAMQTSGVQLFLDAAKRANPGFVLQAADLDALAQILDLTGGLPLGILLAAAWVDMLPVGEIAREVSDSLDFLETEMGDVPDRHRSVRAVFEYSWALLGDPEREIFAALSVFRGGFTRAGAESVAGASIKALATLSSKSLVTPNPDTGRYAVHELLRQYASDELAKDAHRHRAALEAHAAFYAEVMDDGIRLFFECDQPAMFGALDQDIDNIRSAWRHYLSTGNAADALRFMPGFYFLYEVRGWYQSGVSLFGEAVEAFEAVPDDDAIRLRAVAGATQGWSLALLGRPDAGVASASAALEALPDGTDRIHRWIALQCLALALAYTGSTVEMGRLLDSGIEEWATDPDPFWSAGLKNWRSFAAVVEGDVDVARRLLPEAMAEFERRDDHYFTVWTLWLRAMIATAEGRPGDAVDLYARQLARARAIGFLRGKVVALEGLGDANLADGRLEAADEAFVEGVEVADQMSMVRDVLGMMVKIAAVRAALGRTAEAVELLATVCAESISSQQPFTANVPIRETADATLAELKDELDEGEYAAAHARGTARPYDVAAKELMDGLTESRAGASSGSLGGGGAGSY